MPHSDRIREPSQSLWTGLSEIASDGSSVTLRRFAGQFPVPAHATSEWIGSRPPGSLRIGAVVDVETTGLDRKTDVVIELALRKFLFDAETGEPLQVQEGYAALQDPGRPLSREIIEITGLTDEELRGQKIDWTKVDQLLADVDMIIAHNASFDRPFIDRDSAQSRGKLWACSYRQIDWRARGFPSAKLEVLSLFHGFFTAAHRAGNDVDALLLLLSLQDRGSDLPNRAPYLRDLFRLASEPSVKIVAVGSPYETKDILKARGYRWDVAARVWQRTLIAKELASEVSWLEASVYNGVFRGKTEKIPALDNFKEERPASPK